MTKKRLKCPETKQRVLLSNCVKCIRKTTGCYEQEKTLNAYNFGKKFKKGGKHDSS